MTATGIPAALAALIGASSAAASGMVTTRPSGFEAAAASIICPIFENEMPSIEAKPLFEAAREAGIGFYLGYAELDRSGPVPRRFNTSILVGGNGTIVGKYRKIHLPDMRTTSRSGRSSIWRSAISKSAISGLASGALWREHRHVHLQRSPLAGDISGHGPAGCQDGSAWLSYAAPSSARARP